MYLICKRASKLVSASFENTNIKAHVYSHGVQSSVVYQESYYKVSSHCSTLASSKYELFERKT